jgi:hypothetical protein
LARLDGNAQLSNSKTPKNHQIQKPMFSTSVGDYRQVTRVRQHFYLFSSKEIDKREYVQNTIIYHQQL